MTINLEAVSANCLTAKIPRLSARQMHHWQIASAGRGRLGCLPRSIGRVFELNRIQVA